MAKQAKDRIKVISPQQMNIMIQLVIEYPVSRKNRIKQNIVVACNKADGSLSFINSDAFIPDTPFRVLFQSYYKFQFSPICGEGVLHLHLVCYHQ